MKSDDCFMYIPIFSHVVNEKKDLVMSSKIINSNNLYRRLPVKQVSNYGKNQARLYITNSKAVN